METAQDLLIGDFPCDFMTILDLMRQSVSYDQLDPKWTDLSRALNIGAADMKKLERSLLLELRTIRGIVFKMLKIWRAAVGIKATLKLFCEALQRSDLGDIADVLQKHFARVMAGPSTEKSCIPSLPKYYIPRTLSLRTKLRPEIFQVHASDVFIFSGLEKNELTLLANTKPTDVSGNQLKRLTVRFILLELDDDVRDIFKVSSSPTHWVEKKSSCYYWKSSSGSLKLIQQFISQDEETKFTEADFVDKVFGGFNSTPISIADTPGMGKSLLLSSLAHQTRAKYPDRHVAFLVLPDVIQDLFAKQEKPVQDGFKWIHSTLTCIHGQNCHMNVELFLDGYDEILADQLDHAKLFFNSLKELSNLRFAVTTRPHLKNELKATFGLLPCSILPFNVANQMEFLRQFWISNYHARDSMELTRFTSELLTKLEDNKIKIEDERDIAGVPLLCLMLAEVYSDDAVRYSKLGKGQSVEIEVSSIFSVFDMLMQKKLHQNPRLDDSISGSLKDGIINNHVYKAFRAIFPQHESVVPKKQTRVSETQVYAVSLLEFNGITLMSQFVHRTFAEFLVAEYLVKSMSISKKYVNFVFNHALDTKKKPKDDCFLDLSKYKWEDYLLKYPVISYFINGQLGKLCNTTDFQKNYKYVEAKSTFVHKILFVSAVNDLPHCFHFAQNAAPGNQLTDEQLSNLVIIAVKHCVSKDIQKKIIQLVTKNKDRKANLQEILLEPLRIAAGRGNYMYVKTFLNLITRPNNNFLRRVFYPCVSFSPYKSDQNIEGKIMILKLLVSIDRGLLEQRDNEGRTPILDYADSWLIKCLLELGANPNAVTKMGETVFHTCNIDPYESEEQASEGLTELYDCLMAHGFTLFNQRDNNGNTPLHIAVYKYEVEDKVLESFQMYGADFNAINEEGDSVLLSAIKGHRNARFIHRLISRHGCILDNNLKGENALHIATRLGNLEVVQYLVRTDRCNINDQNHDGDTPLHFAFCQPFPLLIAEFLIESGADLKITDKKGYLPNFSSYFRNTPTNRSRRENVLMKMREAGLRVEDYLPKTGSIK